MSLKRVLCLVALAGAALVFPNALTIVLGWASLRAADRFGRDFGAWKYFNEALEAHEAALIRRRPWVPQSSRGQGERREAA
jgi:hypothetical protein